MDDTILSASQNGESKEDVGGDGAVLPVSLAEEQETFYTIEDGPPFADADHSAAYVTPFQPSAPLSVSGQITGRGPLRPTSPVGRPVRKTGRPPWLRLVLAAAVLLGGGAFLFAVLSGQPMLAAHQPATKSAREIPTARPQPTVRVTPPPASWVPQQLPTGWSKAGRSMGDGLFALRTAMTFVDREESLDFRNVGTFTAAVFLLTPAARQRFAQNDVRVADNALFDRVGQQQLIQVEMDPVTNQPRLHHMLVLLLHVDITAQAADAPMGGTGWLVSNYALDQAGGMLAIVQPA